MSAICGLMQPPHDPFPLETLADMVSALAQHGFQGQHLWHAGHVGLGHTIPTSQTPQMPFTGPQGRCTITADARLDNRAELIAALDMPHDSDSPLLDAALLLAAYARWGRACPAHLLGDFAFAIWDAARKTLFCARDPFGVKPLYYAWIAPRFAVASAISGLLALPFVPRTLDEARIADFLLLTIGDHDSTFYAAIRRLPPAHTLEVSPEGLHIAPYWSLADALDVRRPSDAAYAEEFRALFTEAVRCRMRSEYAVGAELSGGLDSSAVVCVARDLLAAEGRGPLPTFTGVMPDVPLSDERVYSEAVLATGGMVPHHFRADESPTLPDPARFMAALDEPFSAVNLFLSWHTARLAGEAGIGVLLDGKDGDTAVSHGFGYLAELAARGRWNAYAATFDAIIHTLAEDTPAQRRALHQEYGFPALTRFTRGLRWWRVPTAVNALGRISGMSRRRLVRDYLLQPLIPARLRAGTPTFVPPARFNPDFAARMADHITARRQPVPPPRTEREAHIRAATSPYITRAWELLDRIAAAFQIEVRHPFYDRRLVEYCVGLPGDLKVRDGSTRWILREALRDVLPSAVLARHTKTHLGHNFAFVFQRFERAAWVTAVMDTPDALRSYVNLDALANDVSATAGTTAYSGTLLRLWTVLLLGRWLGAQASA